MANFRLLNAMCGVEDLARFMHANYRAAFKALHQGGTQFVDGTGCKDEHCKDEHDHGWQACSSKKYFRNRARRILGAPLPKHLRSIDHGGHE